MIKGLVFDFDGVILETEGAEFAAISEVFAEYGCIISPESYSRMVGTTAAHADFSVYEDLESQLGHPVDHDAVRAEWAARHSVLIDALPAMPGVRENIAAAKRLGLRLAVASASRHPWVDGYLKHLGLYDQFDTVVCREDVQNSKPAPDAYLLALERLGLSADEAIAFEDSGSGSLAAVRAGIFVVVIPHALTLYHDLSHADLRLNSMLDISLEDLIALVEKRQAEAIR